MARGGKPKISFRILEIHPEAWKKKKKKVEFLIKILKLCHMKTLNAEIKKKSRPIPELVLYFSKSICNKS